MALRLRAQTSSRSRDDDDYDDYDEDKEYEPDTADPSGLYLLKIEVLGTKKPLWRRIWIWDNSSFETLNNSIIEEFEFHPNTRADFYHDAQRQHWLCNVWPGDGAEPDPTLRQVLKVGATLGYQFEGATDDEPKSRSIITVEQFVHDESEIPEDLVMEEGRNDDDIPDLYFLLKVQLKGYKPPIWRRILIPVKANFSDLHFAIQDKFDWGMDHLAGFYEESRYYSEEICSTHTCLGVFHPDPQLFRILYVGMTLTYIFDFGDCWTHLITVEKVVASEDELPKRLIWAKGDNVPQYPDEDEFWFFVVSRGCRLIAPIWFT